VKAYIVEILTEMRSTLGSALVHSDCGQYT